MTKNAPAHKLPTSARRFSCCTATEADQCGKTTGACGGRGVFARLQGVRGRIGAAALLLAAAGSASGCGVAGDVLGGYDLPESVGPVSEGPWPRLADYDFPTDGPNPETGRDVIAELTVDAAAAAARAEALAGPVMTEAEAKRLRDAGRRSR